MLLFMMLELKVFDGFYSPYVKATWFLLLVLPVCVCTCRAVCGPRHWPCSPRCRRHSCRSRPPSPGRPSWWCGLAACWWPSSPRHQDDAVGERTVVADVLWNTNNWKMFAAAHEQFHVFVKRLCDVTSDERVDPNAQNKTSFLWEFPLQPSAASKARLPNLFFVKL